MLSKDEEDFLSKIPEDKTVIVTLYDEKIAQIAEEIVHKVNAVLPQLEVHHMGASALKMSGQGDIDIYIFSKPDEFDSQIPPLAKIFGEPKSRKFDSVAWKFGRDGHEVELYLTDPTSEPMRKQIKIFETLRKNKYLRNEYEKLKENMNGKSFKEYQRRKYEYYHRILYS